MSDLLRWAATGSPGKVKRPTDFVKDSAKSYVLPGMDPIPLTNWRLDTQDRPAGIIVVRIVGKNVEGKEVVTAPLVERLTGRRVLTSDGKIWRLKRPEAYRPER